MKETEVLSLISEDAKSKFRDPIKYFEERYKRFGIFKANSVDEILAIRSILDYGISSAVLAKDIGCSKGAIDKYASMDMNELTNNLYKDEMRKRINKTYRLWDKCDALLEEKIDNEKKLITAKDASSISESLVKRTRLLDDKSTENIEIIYDRNQISRVARRVIDDENEGEEQVS